MILDVASVSAFAVGQRRTRSSLAFPEIFIVSQTALPAILFLPGTQPLRVPLRVSAYAVSLVGLAIWALREPPRQPSGHIRRSVIWGCASVGVVALMIAHPHTNTLRAGLAQCLLYLAVIAPAIWCAPMVRDRDHLFRLLWVLLVCSAANAFVAVLQYVDPGRWLPDQLSSVYARLPDGLTTVQYIRADGTIAVRPTGLTDSPGAVAGAAIVAVFLGCVFATCPMPRWKRRFSALCAAIGGLAMFVSQVRTAVVITMAALSVYAFVEWRRAGLRRLVPLVAVAVLTVGSALGILALRGEAPTLTRFSSLFRSTPLVVYSNADRAPQLAQAVREYLPSFPLGAGLGRWGQMRFYFGDEANPSSPPLWAELQLPAWILDGGILLVGLYGAALASSTREQRRCLASDSTPQPSSPGKRRTFTDRWPLAAAVFSLDLAIVALVFSYTPFTAPIGMLYWFLAGALAGACRESAASPSRRRVGVGGVTIRNTA